MTINVDSPDFSALPPGPLGAGRYRAAAHEFLPDVAILTPYFNTGDIFEETRASVLAQTLQNWEWLIVDDGSTDPHCRDRLAALSGEDSRITVIHQENAGPGAARNKAFEKSRARYLCLLDSDDLLEPTYLEKCVWFLESNRQFSFCNSYSVIFGQREHLWTQGYERGADLIIANSAPPISVIRRQDFAQAGGFDASIRQGHEDWDFWLAMASHGHWGYTIPEYLQWYRKRADGRFAQIIGDKRVHQAFERRIREKYGHLARCFPNPQRQPSAPFETVPVARDVNNPLEVNAGGRRILFLLPWMAVGGADRVNLDLIEGLVARGHQVTVCTTLPARNPWEHKFSESTADIFALPNFLRITDYPRFLVYLIESRGIDSLVVAASSFGYQLLPFLQAWAPQIAYLDLCHVEEPHWHNGGHPRFGVGFQDALDLNVVSTAHLAQWMTARGADAERIRLMYTGVRAPDAGARGNVRQAVRESLGIARDIPLVVWAGRICEQKRPDVLADILRALRDAGVAYAAVLIGTGDLRPALEARLSRYDLLANVQLLGAVAHDRWLEVLQASDILVMPSRYEGISIALLEAMAAGVVPVVSRVGGQAEVVGAAEGFLIGHGKGEIDEYVAAFATLIGNPEKRAAMSKACRLHIATKFSWSGTIDRFETILDDAHALRSRRRSHFSRPMGLELATQAIEQKRIADALTGQWAQAQHGAADVTFRVNTVVDAQLVRAALLFGRFRLIRRILGSRKFQALAYRIYNLLRNRAPS
jgi:glycosyltransferase involved in cell wall biosynthesis